MFKARVFTALCLIAGFLAVLFLLPPVWATLLFAAVAALAAWEWAGLIRARPLQRGLLVGLVLAGCWLVWLKPDTAAPALWVMAMLFWLGGAPLWLWRKWRLTQQSGFAFALGGLLIVAAWAALVDLHARNPALLLAMMGFVWVADSAAYFAGRAFGRHKLAPQISPGKTWEGVAGGVLGVVAYGLLLTGNFAELRAVGLLPYLFALLLLAAISIVGDLFESLAKRQVGLKDSGNLLPGHGGVLDRIDSLLPTLPIAALILARVG